MQKKHEDKVFCVNVISNGETFYTETVRYIEALRACGIPAGMDVYHSNMHAFDMMRPEEPLSQEAAGRFNEAFAYAKGHHFAPQDTQ